ncbi:hypothetical protein [Janthinobacterium sp. 75]|nr:hypothetical protein [Janthinobacterium sp. 75]
MIAATTAGESVLDATGLGKMARIDQIVVLMMETARSTTSSAT